MAEITFSCLIAATYNDRAANIQITPVNCQNNELMNNKPIPPKMFIKTIKRHPLRSERQPKQFFNTILKKIVFILLILPDNPNFIESI